jgi:hypothetical protein
MIGGKQALAMNRAVGNVGSGSHLEFEFPGLQGIILQLTSEYYKNILFRERRPAVPAQAEGTPFGCSI